MEQVFCRPPRRNTNNIKRVLVCQTFKKPRMKTTGIEMGLTVNAIYNRNSHVDKAAWPSAMNDVFEGNMRIKHMLQDLIAHRK